MSRNRSAVTSRWLVVIVHTTTEGSNIVDILILATIDVKMFLLSNQYVYVYMIKYSSLDAQGGESPPSCGYIFCVPFGTRKSSRPTRGVYVPI